MTGPVEATFAAAMAAMDLGPRVGIAVSGGGDSVALMHLAAGLGGRELRVATVDHGLRPEAALEAARVAAAAAALGLPHETLRPSAPLRPVQAETREARRALLVDWAGRHGMREVLMGHNLDDQAETVLMRLARGGGTEALAGIPAVPPDAIFRRPLLAVRRGDLRGWLRARGIDWIEDPSNDDELFERARIRRVLAALRADAPAAEMLARTARRMGDAAEALEWSARHVMTTAATFSSDRVGALDRAAIAAVPREVARRVLRITLAEIRGCDVRPREAALDGVLDAEPGQGGAGLVVEGCRVRLTPKCLRVFRDPREAALVQVPLSGIGRRFVRWDRKWLVRGKSGHVTSTRAAGLRRPRAVADAGITDLAWQSLPAIVGDGMPRALFPPSGKSEGADLVRTPFGGSSGPH